MPMLFWQLRLSDLPRIRSLFLCSPLKTPFLKMFKFSVLSTEKAAGENVLPHRELPCLCLMICINIIKKAAREVLAAIFMIFYLTERKFVILFLDRRFSPVVFQQGFLFAFWCWQMLADMVWYRWLRDKRGAPRSAHYKCTAYRILPFVCGIGHK